MPVRKITEQQFRTRRKDRKMVWVDAVAVVVGLLILTASVGGVIYAEPDPEPYPYGFSFFETKMAEKHCVEDSTVVTQAGCTHYPYGTTEELVPEGVPIHMDFAEVTAPNVTQVTIRLSFVDRFAESDPAKGKRYDYGPNATDTLRLTVETPWGETVVKEANNDVGQKSGEILMQFNFTQVPEGGNYPAFSEQEVYDAVIPANTVTEHEALGTWRAEVLVVRAGAQEGTAPPDACDAALPDDPAPPDVPEPAAEECDISDQQKTIESTSAGPVLTTPQSPYRSYAPDEGNGWLLDFTVRAYDVTVSF